MTDKMTEMDEGQEAIAWAQGQTDSAKGENDIGTLLFLTEAITMLERLINAARYTDTAIKNLEDCVEDCDVLLKEIDLLKNRIAEWRYAKYNYIVFLTAPARHGGRSKRWTGDIKGISFCGFQKVKVSQPDTGKGHG